MENGVITDGVQRLQIGDYVKYDPTAGATVTTVTSYGADNGYGDQVFNLQALGKTSGAGWKVFGVDEKTGQILIILADWFIGPTTGGYKDDSTGVTYYYIQGKVGYENGVNELNKICNLYGHGKYSTGARCVTIEDVNKITGYNVKEDPSYKDEYEKKYTVNGVDYINTYYYYDIESELGSDSTKIGLHYIDRMTKKYIDSCNICRYK